jgi:hypothetical protein
MTSDPVFPGLLSRLLHLLMRTRPQRATFLLVLQSPGSYGPSLCTKRRKSRHLCIGARLELLSCRCAGSCGVQSVWSSRLGTETLIGSGSVTVPMTMRAPDFWGAIKWKQQHRMWRCVSRWPVAWGMHSSFSFNPIFVYHMDSNICLCL